MKKITFFYLILMFFTSIYTIAQNTIQRRIMITGGITEYSLPGHFEDYCLKSTLQNAGSDLVKNIIKAVIDNTSEIDLKNVTLIKNDSSYNISPLPFNDIALVPKFQMAGPPAEYYIFNDKCESICDFENYVLEKKPKFLANQKYDLSIFNSDYDYIYVVWPIWWFHARTESNIANENWTYCRVAYALFSAKSGDLLFADSYNTEDHGKEIKYVKLVNKIGENILKNLKDYMTK